jgi:hypothetical protein
METQVIGIPRKAYIRRTDEVFEFFTPPGKKIDSFRMVITNTGIQRLQGNHMLAITDYGDYLISAEILDISRIMYETKTRNVLIEMAEEHPMKLLLDTRDQNATAQIRLIMDPLPKTIDLSPPSEISVPDISLPDVANISGVLSFANIVFAIANLGSTAVQILDKAIEGTIGNVGEFSTNVTFAYTANTKMTIIATILSGDHFTLDDVYWTHGVSLIEEEVGTTTTLAAKIYLDGLPSKGDFTLVTKNLAEARLFLEGYTPSHDWLMLDLKGVQNRDVLLYIEGLEKGMGLDIGGIISPDLSGGFANIQANISMTATDAEGRYMTLGRTYIQATLHGALPTKAEIFLPAIPTPISLNVLSVEGLDLHYDAREPIESLYIRLSRQVFNDSKEIYIILHDIPKSVDVDMDMPPELDLEGTPLQVMPNINITTSRKGLDIFLVGEGEAIGQRGLFNLNVIDLSDSLVGRSEKGRYSIRTDGLGFFSATIEEVPYSKEAYIERLELKTQNVRSLTIYLHMLFGAYPIIDLRDVDCDNVEFLIKPQASMYGFEVYANIGVVDLTFMEGENRDVPATPYMFSGGGILKMEDTSRHIIIPEPSTTLMATLLYGGVSR